MKSLEQIKSDNADLDVWKQVARIELELDGVNSVVATHAYVLAYVRAASKSGADSLGMLAGCVLLMTGRERAELDLEDGTLHERLLARLAPPPPAWPIGGLAPLHRPRLRRPARHRAAGSKKMVQVKVRTTRGGK